MNVPDVAVPLALEVLASTDPCAAQSEALEHFTDVALEIESHALFAGDARTAALCNLLLLGATRWYKKDVQRAE